MSRLPTMRAAWGALLGTQLPAMAHDFWMARQPRERHVLVIGAVLLLVLLMWLSLIDPALEARAYWQQTLPTLRGQLADLRAMASEIAASPPSTPSAIPAAEVSRTELERSLNDKGLPAQSLTISEHRVSVHLSNVSFTALVEWLQLTQASAQLMVTEATISTRDVPGRVDAQLTLQRVP